jgi:hypothetical protein
LPSLGLPLSGYGLWEPVKQQMMNKPRYSIITSESSWPLKIGRLLKKLQVFYGGSAKPEYAKDLFAMPDVDGGLIGGASLNADSFLKFIIRFGVF